MTIKTWNERCEEFNDGHITTNADIQRAMGDEIDELRAEIARLRDLCLRASSWVEDVQTDGNEATREKRNFVEQLQLAARKETQ